MQAAVVLTISPGPDSLAKALEAVADQPGSKIVLTAGDYMLTRGVALNRAHSDLVIEGQAGEGQAGPRLLGGTVIDGCGASDRPNIVVCDLAADLPLGELRPRGFARPSMPSHLELFFKGQRMTLARWPNAGQFTKIGGIGDPEGRNDGEVKPLGRLEYGFRYSGDRPRSWAPKDDIYVHGYWAWDWADSYERVASLDVESGMIRTAAPYGLYGFREGQRFYFVNIFEELDEPGEYYVDREARKLYFWPPTPIEPGSMLVSAIEEPVIRIQGASNVTLRGLTIEAGRGAGVVVEGGSGVTLESSVVRNMGNSGVLISGGERHRVIDCEIHHTGDSGLEMSGGDRRTLTAAGHEAVNSEIHHIGEWVKTYNPAIKLNGVGNRLANNYIHDGPHAGIMLTGNDHIIERNEIAQLVKETGDAGALYIGRDYTERGNIVRDNYFHDLGGVGIGSMAVYLDDCSSGTTVTGNIFYNVMRGAFIGGGRDNIVENNVFINAATSVHVDARCTSQATVWHDMTFQTMRQRLEDMRYTEAPYIDRYPALWTLAPLMQAGRAVPPEGNRVKRNLVWGVSWLDQQLAGASLDLSGNLPFAGVMQFDAVARRLRVTDQQALDRIGFRAIPLDRIGRLK